MSMAVMSKREMRTGTRTRTRQGARTRIAENENENENENEYENANARKGNIDTLSMVPSSAHRRTTYGCTNHMRGMDAERLESVEEEEETHTDPTQHLAS